MARKRTYYDVLRVAPDAETEVIKAAYHALMGKMKKHPDLGGNEAEAVLINRAYEVLSNSSERSVYDSLLGNHAAAAKAPEKKEKPVDFTERRRVPRKRVDATISYCVAHDQRWHPGRVKDISTLGIRLQSKLPLIVGQHLVIATSNLATPAVHGVVRWTRQFHPSIFERIYEAGIEFADQITDVEQRFEV